METKKEKLGDKLERVFAGEELTVEQNKVLDETIMVLRSKELELYLRGRLDWTKKGPAG